MSPRNRILGTVTHAEGLRFPTGAANAGPTGLEGRDREAIVGGFFVRPHGPALDQGWVGRERVETQPFRPPFDRVRGAVSVESDAVAIAPRRELRLRPVGDLLQAGPLLVALTATLVVFVLVIFVFGAAASFAIALREGADVDWLTRLWPA